MSDEPRRDPLQPGTRVAVRDDVWILEGRTSYTDCEGVKLRGASSSNAGSTRTVLRPFDPVTPVEHRTEPRVVRPRAWSRHVLAAVARSRPFGSLASAASARIRILPFQLEPALAVLRHGHTRVLLADEVGLGKTVQAGLLLAELSARDDGFRAVVLAPASLAEQWVAELRDKFGVDPVRTDARWLSIRSRTLPADVNPWTLPGVYVASLDFIKQPEVLRPLEDLTWDVLVLDEAHGAGTATARRTAAHAIAVRARRVVLLTATPPDGDRPQLESLTAIGAAGDPIVQFRRSRTDVGELSRRRTVLLHVRLSSAERRMHRALERYTTTLWSETRTHVHSPARLAGTLLGKRAISSAGSLASSVQRRLALLAGTEPEDDEGQLLLPLGGEDTVDDDVADGMLGAPGLADAAHERALLLRVEKLALAAARRESKIRALLRFVSRARQPAIVFTEYRDTLRRIESALRGAGHAVVVLHGGMTFAERVDAVRTFQAGESLLLATDAASEGLNLHHTCRLVVHFELPWTPSRLEQRTGRVDRLGQSRMVHEVLLVARHTAERLVLLPLIRRARAAAAEHGSGKAGLSCLTESTVASAVLGGEPIRAAPATAPRVPQFRIAAEGAREAERVQLERRWGASRGDERLQEVPVLCARRPFHRGGVLLVVQVLLLNEAGQTLHSEIVPLVAPGIALQTREAVHVRTAGARLLAAHWQSVVRIATRVATASLETAGRRHEAVTARLQRREEAILQAFPSAARRLVQAGLFDRRAVKALEKARAAATAALEEADARTGAAALTGASVIRLIGVRV